MQVVKLIWPRPRTLSAKLSEAVWAIRLERRSTKRAILEQYLNRAPFGNRLVGVEAAAQAYFGKSAADVTLAEAALLAALPNAPSTLNPLRFPERTLARQRRIVKRMHALGMISADEATAAESPVQIHQGPSPFSAPHAVDSALRQVDSMGVTAATVQLTIEPRLQLAAEAVLAARASDLRTKGASSAAVVVLDNANAEVAALVGSLDYFEPPSGQVNAAYASRQPGSALKPLAYALALDRGLQLSALLPDEPVRYRERGATYEPRNFDRNFRGPVRARLALAQSLNVPAVHLAQTIGHNFLLNGLRSFGLSTLNQSASHYGHGLVLGVGEVRLVDLAAAYSALARGGVWRTPTLVRSATDPYGKPVALAASKEGRVVSAESAFLVLDALSDEAARAPTFFEHASLHLPFRVAVKTGTSEHARDLWAFGVTSEYTVGVWVGNPNGASVGDVAAAQVAQPLLAELLVKIYSDKAPAPLAVPAGVSQFSICADSGAPSTEACPHPVLEWRANSHPLDPPCALHRQVR